MAEQLGFRNLRATVVTAVLFWSSLSLPVVMRGQTRGVPYDRDFGPGFYELALDDPQPGNYADIRAVNFHNRNITILDNNKHILSRAKLKNGWYEHRGKFLYETVKLDHVYYLSSENSESEVALVIYTWFAAAGSSNTNGIAEVYKLQHHQLKLLEQIGWDEHFETAKPYASFNKTSQTLTVRSGHYLPGDAYCCESADDVVTLRWDGEHLTQTSVSVELTKYGRENGKKLTS